MAGMLFDFVLENANAPGTNLNVPLAGPPIDRISWAQAYTDGSPAFYFIDDGAQAEWGVGTFHTGPPNFISRDTVVGNTAQNTNKLNFTGAVQVYNEIPGERLPYINNNTILAPGAALDTHAGGMPIGASVDYYGVNTPAGWVWANGQALSRTTYALLFAVVGTTYGVGNGTSTFNVPDRREGFALGRAGMGGTATNNRIAGIANWNVLGAGVGDYRTQTHGHTLNWSDPQHVHPITDPGHTHSYRHTILTGGSTIQSGTGWALTDAIVNTNDGVSIGTGLFDNQAATNINNTIPGQAPTINNFVGGSAQNIPPSLVCNVLLYAGPVP